MTTEVVTLQQVWRGLIEEARTMGASRTTLVLDVLVCGVQWDGHRLARAVDRR